jgi:hypothetical protein
MLALESKSRNWSIGFVVELELAPDAKGVTAAGLLLRPFLPLISTDD